MAIRPGINWYDKEILKRVDGLADVAMKEAVSHVVADMVNTNLFDDVTGKLRDSIEAYKSKFKDGGYLVGAWAPHAHLVEMGTGERFQSSPKKSVGQMTPRPFVRQALANNRARILRAFKKRFK